MAVNVEMEPTLKLSMSRSPMIVVLEENGSIPGDFRYLVKLYAWQGAVGSPPSDPVATLSKVPDLDDRGRFNVGAILQDLFNLYNPQTTGQGQRAVWNYRIDSGKLVGATETIENTGTVRQVMQGYVYHGSNVNEYPDSTDILDSKKFLTARPERSVIHDTDDKSNYLSFFWAGETANGGETRFVRYEDDNGNSGALSIAFMGGVAEPDESDEFLVTANVSLAALTSLDPVREYSVWLSEASSGGNTWDKKTFVLPEYRCDVGLDTICFINRFGVWDYFTITAAQKETIMSDPTTYQTRIGRYQGGMGGGNWIYNDFEPSIKVSDNRGKSEYTVQTGWVDESYNDMISDLYLSKFLFSIALQLPLTLKTKSFKKQYDYQAKLINYTIGFMVAVTTIQDVQ